ncbi:GRIP and coiled-coil domain-containing protein 2 isoform X2 [Pleuronectes platessa]|uniref:GRIP and coiled-coil domain-containing protein 2 isoform X2 n=1 Tax=Pleuronectes platessa TaxID=8262 RepID=UPI00232A263F|nr:GRIP and coiled-coil domain-containing protein 2 isoform X2 [Pleuronectes platessa]
MQGHKGLELLMEGNVLGKKTPSAMAGGSHLVWLPLLLSGVFELSDSRHVHPEKNETFISNADVASLLGRFPIKLPEGINPENIHITSVNIESCTDMEAQIHLLNKQLQETTFRSSKQDEEAFGLRRNVRLLRMQLATCSSSASAVTGPYQTQLYSQMKLLLEKFDSDAFLNLKVIVLTREVTALQRRIELAANSTETEIMVLRNELQVKMKDLHAKKQQIERRFSNSELILQIISLQNQIWDLGVEELRRGETVLQPDSRIAALQTQLDMKLRKLRQQGDASSVLLEFISGHSRIAAIQRLINVHIAKSRANYADYQMQMRQKNELLAKKILRLNREESNTELTREILSLQDELATLTQMITHAKTSDRLTGLRVILEQGKSQQEHLQKQLEETDFGQAQLIMKIIGMIREGREQQRDGQQPTTSTTQTTVLTLLRGEYAKAQADIKELQRLVQEKSENCPGNKERYSDLKTEFEQKIAELNRTGDSKAAIILNVINLHGELTTLRDLISITKHPDRLSDLQRQLEQKEEELNSKTADMKRLIANPNLILSFNQLQQEIWELQESGLNGTTRNKQRELQTRVDGLIREMNNKGDESIKLMLKIMTLQSQVKQLQKELLDHHTVKDATVTQLEKDLSTKEKELKKSVDELTEKNQANAQLIVTITDLNNRLRKLQQEMQSGGQITSATITKLKKQLKIKEEEHFRDQVEITALQNELNQTTAQCSGFGKKIQELQTDLDEKLKKLQSESDSVTSLALQVSTITVQLEELKRQLQNTDSEAKIQELQKQIEEKNNKLAEKTEELKARSAQPQRFLDIISIQTKISKLVNTAANNTDYRKIRALQYHLTDLINGIRDENNENTQLLFKVLTLQEEVARLKKQEKSQSEAQLKKIKDLENELEDIRSQIAEKTLLLDSRDLIFSNLSAQIMELHQKIKPLEDEISDLKNQHAESFAELQARLSLTKRQLQDSELRLKDADAKNFKSMMDIIDLRDQLTKAEKQASKAAGKNIYVLEQQLQTQQRENKKLENSNRDLKQTLKELKMCCNDQNTLCEVRQTQLQVCQQDMDRLEQENRILQDRLQQSKQKVEDLQQQLPAKDAMLNRLQQELEEKATENKRMQDKCSSIGSGYEERYSHLKTEFEQKIAELNRTGDSKAAIILNVINLHGELTTLRDLISTTKHPERLSDLQRQLEEKEEELNSKTADMKRLIVNPNLILSIIELQQEIWDLQQRGLNGTTRNKERELQTRVHGLITEINNKGDESIKLVLKIMTLQSQVKQLQKELLDQHTVKDATVTQLEKDLFTKEKELKKSVDELTEKNQANAQLIVTITDLNNRLRKLQQETQSGGQITSATITKLKKQLKIKEEEHFRDQVEITALQNELNETTAQCSGFGKKIQELQTDLDEKLKKLQSESDSVSSLALQVSTITLQLEELKRQLQNTDSEAKIQELQKQIEEKNNKLAEKTEELKARSAQPQRFLDIISIQTKISKLVNTAANNTDYNQIRALQGQLNDLIDGIKDENNENTQLLFKVLTLQEEVARLKKQEKSQSEAQLKKIKDLENELEDIRSQIAEKTLLLYTRNSNFSNLSAEITELRQKIKPLEDEISDLKNQHAESFAELQARLSLTKRQLQDSELRLKDADAKNFKSMMDIIDLRDQLTKAQKQASKAAGKNIDVLEQQLQTQQRENKKLENSNRELKKQLKIKEEEHFRDQVEITALQNELNQTTAQCSGFGKKIQELQTDLDEKLKKLQSESDSVSSLALQVSTITLQLEELKRQLQNTDSEAKIQELQKQIEEKNNKLAEKTEELKARSAQPQRFLHIISIQTKISKLVNTAANNTDYNQIRALQGQLNDLIDGIQEENNENTQLLFKVLTLQEEVARLKKQEKSQSEAQLKKIKDLENELEDIRSQIAEKTLLLYTRNSNFSNLSAEITELRQKIKPLEDEISDLKNQHAESFAELQARLSLTKRQLQDSELRLKDADAKNFKSMMDIIDLRDQLTKAQKQASKAAGKNIDVLEQQLQTQQRENKKLENSNRELKKQLKIKEEEHFRDQVEITALQNELNQMTAQCSGFGKKIQELQTDLDEKLKKLQSESDSVSSLALQVSTITLQLEELKRQLQNTDSEAKIQELQKQIEEKNNKLAEKTEELKARSAQPQRFLDIISIQTKISKLVNTAANNTDYSQIRALQGQLNDLIDGIKEENNENTQLLFKVLTLQEEVARLKKQEKSQSEAQLKKIKDLENELEDIRSQIAEKTLLLYTRNSNFSNLSAEITELRQKIKPLEDEISDLKNQHAESFAELQARLSLTKRQLQDSELRLKDADAKNFKSMMDIIDLRDQLTKAQKQASKAAGKNIDVLEQQLQTQQRENQKLENSNRERQTQLQVCEQDMDRLGQQLQQGDARLKQLQQDTEEQMRQSNRRHQHENQILQDQLQQSKQKVEDLQQQLPAKDAMLNRLQQELEEKATENNGLQDKYSNLQNEKNELAEKVQGKYSFCLVEYPPKELLLYSVFSLYPGLQNQLSDVEDRTIHTRKSTFDPNTANPRIVLSADHTEMSTTEEVQNVQDHPGRFDVVLAILGETGFSSGRHYWEVSVAGKSCFHLGMASESAQRRGSIIFRPTNGYWTIVKNKQGQYRAIDNRSVVLRGQPQLLTLGILLDYEKGQVSFYNAGDRSHIYSFQSQRFTDKIHPFVNFCVEDTERRTPIVLLTPGSTEWIKNAV